MEKSSYSKRVHITEKIYQSLQNCLDSAAGRRTWPYNSILPTLPIPQADLVEIKSPQRDEAAAANDEFFKYYE